MIFVLIMVSGCTGGPDDGDLYRYRPNGDTVRVLGVGRIGELKTRFAEFFRADSMYLETGKAIAHIDSIKASLGGRYTRVRDSLTVLEAKYRAEGAVYDPTVSEYTECCSFRQFGHFIIMSVSDFNHDYEKVH